MFIIVGSGINADRIKGSFERWRLRWRAFCSRGYSV